MSQEQVRVSNFQEVYERCRKAGKPLCISAEKDGNSVLLMDFEEAFRREQSMKQLQSDLLVGENEIKAGHCYTIEDVDAMLQASIKEVANGKGTAV